MLKHQLYMSLRSPFARRCRILMEELNIPYDSIVMDVFQPPQEYFSIHPLGRVPALITDYNEKITDSHQIMDYLYERFGTHALFTSTSFSANKVRNIRSYAVGVMEMIVTFYLERIRPVAHQDVETLEECTRNAVRALTELESIACNRKGEYLQGDAFSIADIDVGTAYGYYQLRMLGRNAFAKEFPVLDAYYKNLSERSSFKKTEPPA